MISTCKETIPKGRENLTKLLPRVEHDHWVVAVKFSPNGQRIAIATWNRDVRVYDSQNGDLLVAIPISVVSSELNQSLTWTTDSRQLFALSHASNVTDINCINVSAGKTLSRWPIGSMHAQCIALAGHGAFIAPSTLSSVLFWDTAMHKKIDSVIHHTADIVSMAISSNYDLVTAGGKGLTIRNLCDVLPSPYCNDVSAFAFIVLK